MSLSRKAVLRWTLRGFSNANRFPTFKIFRQASASFRSQTVMLQPQDIVRPIEEFFRLAAGNSRRYGCQGHEFAFGDRSR